MLFQVFSFTRQAGNYGGIALQPNQGGEFRVTTHRFDSLFKEEDIYFLKLDMEGAEKHTIGVGKPMDPWFQNRKVPCHEHARNKRFRIRECTCTWPGNRYAFICQSYRQHVDY